VSQLSPTWSTSVYESIYTTLVTLPVEDQAFSP
jgi:hypothetical protein